VLGQGPGEGDPAGKFTQLNFSPVSLEASDHAMKLTKYLTKVLKRPFYYANVLLALGKGAFYMLYYRIIRKNVRIRLPFFAFARVTISGPGSVVIGKKCAVLLNGFRGLTIVTLSKDARVTIGRGCHLGGTTIRSFSGVSLGNEVMTASTVIQDIVFVNVEKAKRTAKNVQLPGPKSIEVGENVWLGGHSVVLGGSKIGNDSVLGAAAVCSDMELKDYCLGSGNPVARALSIDRLLKLKGE
jgi:acetyltransferase-like isoleucine patch superfamily enzyme